MGALLARCSTEANGRLTPGDVTALGEWVAGLERLAVGALDRASTTDPLADRLVGRSATDSPSADPAMARE